MKKRLFTHTGVCWLIVAGAANVLGIASAQDTGDATTKVAAFAAGSDYLQTGPGTEATLPIGGKMVKVTLTGVPIQGSTGGTLGNTDPIVSRDPSGRPVRVIAQYSYAGMQGTQRGRVTVSFKDGSPDCLYFSDNPDSCRLPAAGVVSAYEKNAYA